LHVQQTVVGTVSFWQQLCSGSGILVAAFWWRHSGGGVPGWSVLFCAVLCCAVLCCVELCCVELCCAVWRWLCCAMLSFALLLCCALLFKFLLLLLFRCYFLCVIFFFFCFIFVVRIALENLKQFVLFLLWHLKFFVSLMKKTL
jgi:hypothetical protein